MRVGEVGEGAGAAISSSCAVSLPQVPTGLHMGRHPTFVPNYGGQCSWGGKPVSGAEPIEVFVGGELYTDICPNPNWAGDGMCDEVRNGVGGQYAISRRFTGLRAL